MDEPVRIDTKISLITAASVFLMLAAGWSVYVSRLAVVEARAAEVPIQITAIRNELQEQKKAVELSREKMGVISENILATISRIDNRLSRIEERLASFPRERNP